jgi:hypothetical protein
MVWCCNGPHYLHNWICEATLVGKRQSPTQEDQKGKIGSVKPSDTAAGFRDRQRLSRRLCYWRRKYCDARGVLQMQM